MPGNLTAPRPLPDRTWAQLAASALIVLALPVFFAAGWPLKGWLLAATLWLAAWLFGYFLTKLPVGADRAASSIAVGLGMSFRTVVVGVVLVVVASSNERVGLAAAAVYALAFTAELVLSLVTYYSGEPL